MDEKTKLFWECMDKRRDRKIEIDSIIECLIETNIKPNPTIVEEILTKPNISMAIDMFITPNHLSMFIIKIAKLFQPISILDPYGGSGFLAWNIINTLKPRSFDVLLKILSPSVLTKKVMYGDAAKITYGEPLKTLEDLTNTYDVIISHPPFGFRHPDYKEIRIDNEVLNISDEYGALILIKSCAKLKTDGIGIFIMRPSFFFNESPKSGRANLDKLGLSINACIEIPAGTFSPITGISSYLVIIKKSKQGKLFIAKYSQDERHQDVLINNFFNNKTGKTLSLGHYIELGDFKGFSTLEAKEKFELLSKKMGLKAIPMKNFVLELNRPSKKEFKRLEEKPNSVYLPEMAKTPATTSQENLPKKLKSYFQLVLKAEIAKASFVAKMFNQPIGYAWRESIRSGEIIPRINKDLLMSSDFFLPPINVQEGVIASHDEILNIRNELSELDGILMKYPYKYKEIHKKIRSVNREQRFQDWLETLPFPLASILWTYYVQKDSIKEKLEKLLHFFEALTEFCATIHLSAYYTNKSLYNEHWNYIFKKLNEHNLSFETSSFGTWKLILEYLSAKSREMINDEPEKCFALYRTKNDEIIKAILAKELLGIIQDTNSIRNKWQGHRGALSESQAIQIHSELSPFLDRIRILFGTLWESYELIKPEEAKHREGIFYYKAKRIMGTRIPFESINIETIEVLDDGYLYLIGNAEYIALKILPFVKIMPSPKKADNACYFYNRKESTGKIRFISYHYEHDSEVIQEFKDTALIIKQLTEDFNRGTNG